MPLCSKQEGSGRKGVRVIGDGEGGEPGWTRPAERKPSRAGTKSKSVACAPCCCEGHALLSRLRSGENGGK
eukprot:893972-Rhodomonas_salina.1